MAIGERIHFFRILRGMTQKYLGTIVGFPERSADVRLAQYETGTRKPKAELTAALAQALDVSPHALDVPDIDSYIGLMHTLFTLEDLYGLTVSESDGEICLKVDTSKGKLLIFFPLFYNTVNLLYCLYSGCFTGDYLGITVNNYNLLFVTYVCSFIPQIVLWEIYKWHKKRQAIRGRCLSGTVFY